MDIRHTTGPAPDDEPNPLVTQLVGLRVDGGAEVPRMVVFGEVDEVNAARLHRDFVDVLRHHRPPRIEMDFHAVSFLNSVGVRKLLLCEADARQLGCGITITEPQPAVYRVLQMTGLLDHFGLTDAPPPGPAASRADTAP